MYNFEEYMRQSVAVTEKALDSYLPKQIGQQKILIDAMRYSLLDGGKRLRSSLVLEFCAECGGLMQEAVPFACAVEMVHAFSLIHDDLPCMDDDDMRRGKPSCHIAYGESTALLAGDALVTKAFEVMLLQKEIAPERVHEAALVLAEAVGGNGMIGGQVMDLANEGKSVPIESITETDSLKTGALIRASARIGCIIGGGDEFTKDCADEYAQSIGVAFQIADDILDCVSSIEVLGKPIGSDTDNRKTTYVSVYGISEARRIAECYIKQAKLALEKRNTKSKFLYDLADFVLDRKK